MNIRTGRPRARHKLVALLGVVAVVSALAVAPTLAALDTKFELDKNASNDLNVTKFGDLGANINATQLTIPVCRTAPEPATFPFTILINAERLSVTGIAGGSFGGNCPGTKVNYNVLRGFGPPPVGAPATAPNTHSKGGVDGIISLIVSAPSKAGPDWNQVHAAVLADPNTTCSALGLVECSFIEDGIGPTTFIGGASKDHLPISGWMHTSGASPDKAEILNAYAAKAIDGTDQILYFGMDRYAVDGSTDIGFWFFQNPVAALENGTFTGSHVGSLLTNGDILALGTFTQGGATTNIRVFKWVGTGGNESGTIDGPVGTFGDCVGAPSNSPGCATVNDTTIEVPWNYQFKGSAVGKWIPAGGFFEGAINLTANNLQGCFSSFLAETRSSPEITAILKDFTLGSFEACDSALTTKPGDGAASPDNVLLTDTNSNTIVDTSIGTGSVQVRDRATLNVTGIANWSGTMDFWLCRLDGTALCDGTTNVGTKIGSTINVTQATAQPILSAAATVTEAGRYCWRGVFTSATQGVPNGTDSRIGECFEVLPVTPTISTNALAGPVVAGSSISDTATLAATASQPGSPIINGPAGAAAGGSITFRAYGPNDPNCSGTAAFTSAAIPVSGNGTYASGNFTPSATGTYRWIASYTGNSPNTNAVSGACNDANETSNTVDGNISITPSATNKVGDPHTFTITANALGNLVPTSIAISPSVSPAPDSSPDTCSPPTISNGGKTATCTLTVNSASVGVFTANATATFTYAGPFSFNRSTNGTAGPGGSGPATKTFVDARISIGQSGTNQVGSAHTFTVTVEKNDGSGWAPTSGVTVNSTETGAGDITGGTCGPTGPTAADGTCTVIVNSTATGSSTVHATATVTVGGVNVAVDTNGYGANSISNVKTWADARISIGQTGTNQVGSAHTFTVTVEQNDGTGWAPAEGVTVNSTETGVGEITGGSCGPTGSTAADGTCTIIVNSTATGSSTVHATATVTVGGVNVAVDTNGYGANSISNVKTWADARISIAQSGTNQVGGAHTFTVTVEQNDGTGWTPAAGVTVNSTETGVGDFDGGTCAPSGSTAADGTCTIIVNSTATGSSTVNATATVTVGGVPIAVDTNGYGAHNISNTKTWVDARISIAQSGTNQVNGAHTFTVTVEQNDGSGWAPASGVTVTSTETGVGDFEGGSCAPSGPTAADGTCTVIVNSTATGSSTVHATATVTVGGVNVAVDTNGYGATTVSNVKTWVDARISIAQSGTNEVSGAHTFTVTVEQNDGTGWTPADGVTVDSTESGIGDITGGTCGPTGPTAADGTCTVIVNSTAPGLSTVHATATVTVGGVNVAVDTNGYGATTVSNVKTWVDANISITPETDSNSIGEDHVLTGHVNVNSGTGGYVSAPAGTTISFTIDSGPGSLSAPSCLTIGTTGSCTVTLTSNVAGTTVVSASTTVVVGGVSLTRTTSGADGNSGTASKIWVEGSIRWLKRDNHGALLGGATFEVCRTHRLDSATSTYVVDAAPAAERCFTILDNDASDADLTAGELQVNQLVLGRYTVEETIPPAGYHIGNPPGAGPFTFPDMTIGAPDVELATIFVNSKAFRIIVITCDDITDTLVDGTVTIEGVEKETLSAADFAALGWKNSAGDPLSQADFCNQGGASYGDLDEGVYNAAIEVPDRFPFFPL